MGGGFERIKENSWIWNNGVEIALGGDGEEESVRGIHSDKETWGSEYTIQRRADVLWNCTPGAYVILFTSVNPINSLKKKKNV